MKTRTIIAALLVVATTATLMAATTASAFQLPGTGAKNFIEGENMDIHVNVLTSTLTHLPFDYYSIPVCRPEKRFSQHHNLGEILLGDRIMPSPYEHITAGDNAECSYLCPDTPRLTPAAKTKLEKLVKQDYMVNLIMDGLPLAMEHEGSGPSGITYSVGVPLGYIGTNGEVFLYNHIHFTVKYYELTHEERSRHHAAQDKKHGIKHEGGGGGTTVHADAADEEPIIKRIISFVGHPMSIKHGKSSPPPAMKKNKKGEEEGQHHHHHNGVKEDATCHNDPNWTKTRHEPLALKSATEIRYSYGITWQRTDELWTTRWDVYLMVADHEVHWFAIINATLVVVLLTIMVAIIFMRVLNKDISTYNRVKSIEEEYVEETGWKMVAKDVFRPPEHPELLAAIIGSGAQLCGMASAVIVFAALGFLAPSNRGALFTALLVFFVFLGVYGGYTSARFLKLWNKQSWFNIGITATLVPGVTFTTFFCVNLLVWSQGSSGAVPLLSLIAVICLWFFISVPLVFVGAVFGYRSDAISVPVQPTAIPKHIPETLPWHMQPYTTIPIAGVLPFGAVFLEFFFILSAVWLNRYYYVFGFLLLVCIILATTCAQITIILTYFQLCSEDYNWWYRSFVSSGACAGYIWLYAVYYFFSAGLHHAPLVPMIIYFAYMTLTAFLFFVATGTIGFLATFHFLRFLYSKVRIE